VEFVAVHGGEYHSPVNVATSPRPDDAPGAGVSDRQQSPTFFVPTRFSCAGGRARARGCSYSGADRRRPTRRRPRRPGPAHDQGLQRGAMGTTGSGARDGSWRHGAWRQRLARGAAAAALALAPDLACADETGESFGPRDPSGASPPRRRSPASRCRRPGTVPRRRPAARSRARAPSGSDGSRPRSPKT